jgi:hypothetical protein
MKKIILFVLVCFLVSGGYSFAGQFGAMQTMGEEGDFSFGPGVFSSSADMEGIDSTIGQTMLFLQAGYVMTDNVDVYARVGTADMTAGDLFDDEDFSDGYAPFTALGVKALVIDNESFSLGAFAEGSYFLGSWEDSGEVNGVSVAMEIGQSYELNTGLIFQTEVEGAEVYLGPLFFIHEGNVDISGSVSDSGTYEEDTNIGGFFGICWPMKNGINIELEGQVRSAFSAGATIQYVF